MVAALKPGNRVLVNPLVPDSFTLDTFREAWTQAHLGRYLLNSAIVATAVTIGQVITSLLAAYAFAMLRFPGRNVLFVVYLATMLVPLEATLVVNRQTIDDARMAELVPGTRRAVPGQRLRGVPLASGALGAAQGPP